MIRLFIGAAIFAALLFVRPVAGFAQDVSLTSRDGAIAISGTLLSFDGEFYEVDTAYGRLVLDGQGVNCIGVGCPNLTDYIAKIRFSGAPALGDVLLPSLVQNFAHRRGLTVRRIVLDDTRFSFELRAPDADQIQARIDFHLHSTDEAFADLLAQETDIAMAMREVRPAEAALLHDAGLGDVTSTAQARIIALDALVPIVALGNPLDRLSVENLADMLSGTTADWGDGRGPITVRGLSVESGVAQAVEDRMLAPLGAVTRPDMTRHARATELADAIARDPFGIGVTRYSETANTRPVLLTDRCGIALPVTRQSIKAEDYPFTAPLFLYLPAQRLPLMGREFLRYLDTEAAQKVIRRAGFVDQAPEMTPMSQQGLRLAAAIQNIGDEMPATEVQRMVSALQDASRLTLSFRFRGGSSDLDAQSSGNVRALAQALERGEFDGREVLFAGFSDGEGGWEVNRRIAHERAAAVLNAVKKAAISADFDQVSMRVEAFGEAMPVACDDTDWGRHANRRVEVWLR